MAPLAVQTRTCSSELVESQQNLGTLYKSVYGTFSVLVSPSIVERSVASDTLFAELRLLSQINGM